MEDHSQHFSGNVAQKAIIERDGKMLVCRGVGDTVWELPGGRLHDGEKPVDGIVREIKEEFGVIVTNVRPFRVERNYHFRSKCYQVFIVYRCVYDGSPMTVDDSEIEEMKWVTPDELRVLPMFDDGGTKEVVSAYLDEIV